ncbi:MAG: recombination protein RecR [Planctomycetaceae bacterium]|nr:recombination mediator RecR [Planctomycetota bacterium]NUN53625.1 recombination protein RecR [Planctomycetaceae bacterium]
MGEGRPESVERLVEELGRLPGVGRRTAERLADHLVRAGTEEAMALAIAIRDVKKAVRPCSLCGNFAEADPCALCTDDRRDRALVCVVSSVKDLLSLERAGVWKGVYHVLGGRVAPLEGTGPEDLRLGSLVERVRGGGLREVVLATDSDAEGDMTAHHVARALSGLGVRVTRLSRGIPAGSSVEFASPATLGEALEGRREV